MNVLSNRAVRDIETLVHPYTNLAKFRDAGPLVIERAKGVYVYDSDGKAYIEGMAGLWCTSLGYGNEELVEAAAAQMRKLSFAHLFNGRSHDPAIELAERLKEIAPVPISKVFFCKSGSEANDTQIKLVWYMNNGLGRPKKKKIMSRQRAYHGVTIAAASLTGLAGEPHRFRPADRRRGAHRLPAPLSLRARRRERGGIRDPPRRGARRADPARRPRHRRRLHRRAGDGRRRRHRAAGDYFEKIMKVCAKYDLLMIADEVICGFGRLGTMFGSRRARLQARRDLRRQGAVVGLSADRRRDDAGTHVPGDARREPQDRHLRPRLHLFRPSGRRGGRDQDTRDLRARPHRRRRRSRRSSSAG